MIAEVALRPASRWFLLIAGFAAALFMAAEMATGATPDPIVGTWTSAGGARISVTGAGPFVATLLTESKFGPCTQSPGLRVWEFSRKADGTYEGTAHGVRWDSSDPATCRDLPLSLTVKIGAASGGQLSMTRCVAASDVTAAGCSTWTRPAPATPTAKAAARLSLTLFKKQFVVAQANRASCSGRAEPSRVVFECTVKNGAVVSFCNRDQFNHGPLFSFSTKNRFKSPSLRPGACFQRRFVNPTRAPVLAKVYDEIHSQERLVLRVMPA